MYRARVMPCLLLQDDVLVKTLKFSKPSYVGDAINAVRIYNELQVDELVFLDIGATKAGREPSYKILQEIATECFMPLAYGGGIRSVADARAVLGLGFEKVVVGTAAFEDPELIPRLADTFGSQAVVVSLDVRAKIFGKYEVYVRNGSVATHKEVRAFAQEAEALGAGEILLYSIDRDGTRSGYELSLIRKVSSAVNIPVIACGGANEVKDFGRAVHEAGASACAAGSMAVHFGPHRAVLINFPEGDVLDKELI